MQVDEKLVDYVAQLSRIHIEDKEKAKLAEQLGRIIGYVEKLAELDTEGVEPMAHPLDAADVFRADEEKESLSRDGALANAPDRKDDFFTVPAVIE
jgi:aspartyl-tRNA(Asn)/glutamyl-tRNA(Gln) amidotransferase subunit C